MLLKELKSLKLSHTLVSVDRDCHDEELTGFVLVANKSFIVMSLYTDDGTFNGFSLFETDQIDEVYWGNREHRSIRALISDNDMKTLSKLKSSLFKDAVLEINGLYSSVNIFNYHSEDKFEVAKIVDDGDGWLKIHTFGPKRSLSRLHKLIQVDSISRIEFDSPYQNKVVDLHELDL